MSLDNAGEYVDPDDGAPSCRMCGDEGFLPGGSPCSHRGRHEHRMPWLQEFGQAWTAALYPGTASSAPMMPVAPAIGDRYEDAPF